MLMAQGHGGRVGRGRARRIDWRRMLHEPAARRILAAACVAAVVVLLRLVVDVPAEAEAATSTASPVISGVAYTVDGDTLRIDGQRIRLYGIDAFEADQMCEGERGFTACGLAATRALSSMVAGHPVECEILDTDRYQRAVARCSADGVDVGDRLVREGHALAIRRYSADYVAAEESARTARAGAWAGSFDRPEQWRSRQHTAS